MTAPVEEVVLLDESGHAIGRAPKATTHHADTPLHLAFSCYVFDADGRLLLTRRALDKPTFPGVWTNSVCGHPAPGEDLVDTVARRAGQELGLVLDDVQLVLPAFRYSATMPSGVRENELCPVFTARTASTLAPDPSEVADVEWVAWPEFRDAVLSGSREVSVWCAAQVAELARREDGVGQFAEASYADLPPAARDHHPSRGPDMATTRFTVHTTLSPSDTMALITDFGPDRAKNWPNVDDAHFTLHDQGPDWAEVTEGNSMAWERERYTWDTTAGTVAIDTVDSNIWAAGSSWRYVLTPAAGGTDLEVSLTRVPKSFKGKLVAALIPLFGAKALGKQFRSVLKKAESR